jgi:CheY-like chemotaxis protein
MRKNKVLIIDDDPAVTAVYEVAFQLEKFDVRAVNSGNAAFSTLREFKPDAVVLDLNMPGIHGLRWLQAVRAVPDFKELPVVVLTASPPGSPEVQAAFAAGVKGVLTKNQWGAEAVTEAIKWSLIKRAPPSSDFDEPNWAQAPL